ncbi:hypothetical protein [Pedobacter sp. N23S346]|uniref:hypothetical protein n=1 Tax=Pedobacter sp. N23S346 TaxID=3402750 RepID=UPI003AC8B264
MRCKFNHICIILLTALALTGCNPTANTKAEKRITAVKVVDKTLLVAILENLHKVLSEKNYSLEKGLNVIRPYLSEYKICIPGFSEMVPYNATYLYVNCIYDTKSTPPRVLSFRFQMPNELKKQLHVNDIRKPFKQWVLENTISNPDGTISNIYNAGQKNVSITIIQEVLPNQTGSVITQIIIYR